MAVKFGVDSLVGTVTIVNVTAASIKSAGGLLDALSDVSLAADGV